MAGEHRQAKGKVSQDCGCRRAAGGVVTTMIGLEHLQLLAQLQTSLAVPLGQGIPSWAVLPVAEVEVESQNYGIV